MIYVFNPEPCQNLLVLSGSSLAGAVSSPFEAAL